MSCWPIGSASHLLPSRGPSLIRTVSARCGYVSRNAGPRLQLPRSRRCVSNAGFRIHCGGWALAAVRGLPALAAPSGDTALPPLCRRPDVRDVAWRDAGAAGDGVESDAGLRMRQCLFSYGQFREMVVVYGMKNWSKGGAG
jgi:hypothetical protein